MTHLSEVKERQKTVRILGVELPRAGVNAALLGISTYALSGLLVYIFLM